MKVLSLVLGLVAFVVSVYTLMCVTSFIVSWFPEARSKKFAAFLAKFTDPFFNLFKGKNLLNYEEFDLTPLVGVYILSVISSILSGISHGRIRIYIILSRFLRTTESWLSGILGVIFIVALVRWIVLQTKKNKTEETSSAETSTEESKEVAETTEENKDSKLSKFDALLKKIAFNIAGKLSKTECDYQKALMYTWIASFVADIVVSIVFTILVKVVMLIPV